MLLHTDASLQGGRCRDGAQSRSHNAVPCAVPLSQKRTKSNTHHVALQRVTGARRTARARGGHSQLRLLANEANASFYTMTTANKARRGKL